MKIFASNGFYDFFSGAHFLQFKVDYLQDSIELKGTHARDFMVRFSQFFGIIQ